MLPLSGNFLKMATQVESVVKKGCGKLAFNDQGIDCNSQKVMRQLYRTLVRPHIRRSIVCSSG